MSLAIQTYLETNVYLRVYGSWDHQILRTQKRTIERKNLYKDKLTSSLNENLGAYIKTMIPRFRNRENKICCLGRVVRFVDFNSSFCLSSCWLPGL